MKTNYDSRWVAPEPIIPHLLFLQEEDPIDDEEEHKVSERLEQKMKRLEFEMHVFFYDQRIMLEEDFEKNQVYNQDIPALLDQFNECELTPEFLKAYERTEQLDYAFGNDAWRIQQAQNLVRESLERIEEFCDEVFKASNLDPFSSELIKQVSAAKHYESKAELMFIILKAMDIFRFKVDDEDWLNVFFTKGNGKDISYRQITEMKKVDLKIESMKSIETMLFGLNFLLENCLEKVSSLCLSFNGINISNQEAKRFNRSRTLKNSTLKLTVDFCECTFESEETPLMIINDGVFILEDLGGFSWFLGETNATQKTVNNFCQLVESKMKNLRHFSFDGSHLSFTPSSAMSTALFGKASELLSLELGVQQTPFLDDQLIFLSEKVLPELKKIEKLKLWLGYTQVTDKGLLSLFRSIAKNCASRLKAFLLGTAGNNVTDESFTELALNVLPLMEGLEELNLYVQRTLISDKSRIAVCKNMKYFAYKLRKFGLNVGGTAASDAMLNALPLKSMGKLSSFNLWLNRTRITDKGLGNLFSSMMSTLEGFELNCSETAITDESLKTFAKKTLPKMTNLKKFNFYANRTKVQEANFLQNLSKCHKLHKMTIWLNEARIKEEAILTLAESIPFLVNLTHLSLSFNKTKLEDLGVSRLCESLKNVAKNLEFLKLGLDDTKVTDKGISALGNESLQALKEFSLGLSNTQVGDAGLKSLFENLKGVQNIQLCLGGSLIADESLLALAEKSFRKAEDFRSIELNLANTKVSDMSLALLMRSLRNKVCNVKKLSFLFQNTKITGAAFQAFSELNFRNLQELQFNFEQTQVNDIHLPRFMESLANKVQRVKKFELRLNDAIHSLKLFASNVLPNLIQAEDFKLHWNTRISSFLFQALCLNAKKAIKNIKTFHFSPLNFEITSDPYHEGLKELSFELNERQFDDIDMQKVLESFEGQVSQVKSFTFLVQGTNISSNSIQTLGEKLFPFMVNLENLKIGLETLDFSNDIFCSICRSFAHFASNLKELRISLGTSSLSNKSLTTLANYGLAHMTNLVSFDMYFFFREENNIEKGLVEFFSKMQNCMKKLKYFSLSLLNRQLPPEAIKALATYGFQNLTSCLTEFFFELNRTGLNDSEFALLFSGLNKEMLKSVENFKLMIDEPALTDQAFDYLSTNIVAQLKNTEYFVCYTHCYGKITDETFIKFNKSIQKLSNKLSRLFFRLENIGISNVGVKEFALETLIKLKNLRIVDVSFAKTAGVNDEAALNLFEGLGRIFARLSSLKLSLRKTGITDVTIEALKKSKDLDVWKNCTFDFSDNPRISEGNQNFIKQQFIKK